MRNIPITLLAMMVLFSCENPGSLDDDQALYQGRTIHNERAPFLLQMESLAKTATGSAVIEDAVAEGTVYGLQTDTEVYAAQGGEALPAETWIDNQSDQAVTVYIGAEMTIYFEQSTIITLVNAENTTYKNSEREEIPISGDAVISTSSISTGTTGSVTLIAESKFTIGGDGGDMG